MTIELTRGLQALVDDADAALVSAYRWHVAGHGRPWYAATSVRAAGSIKRLWMHRLILGLDQDDLEVDHINGDGLDNRRCNLRVATRAQNARNHRRSARNSSGYSGVSWDAQRGTWYAQITCEGQLLRLGRFSDLLDAARAYDAAAQCLFGAFARLNGILPDGPELEGPELATSLGHDLGAQVVIAGINLRRCSRCSRHLIAKATGTYCGTALEQPCCFVTPSTARKALDDL